MKVKYKKKLKLASDVEVDDQIKIGGIVCLVVKVENIFHYAPNMRVRLELRVQGATTRRENAILMVHHETPLTVLK
jgi:hypothetical protein